MRLLKVSTSMIAPAGAVPALQGQVFSDFANFTGANGTFESTALVHFRSHRSHMRKDGPLR